MKLDEYDIFLSTSIYLSISLCIYIYLSISAAIFINLPIYSYEKHMYTCAGYPN